VLLDALARPETSGWVATIAAEGPERDGLEARAHLLRISDRVVFSPLLPRAEFHALVRSHHLVVVPSRAEGLGLIALEALALGRPVIASAVGGLVEVIDDSTDGLLVPPADPDALAKALATVTLTRPTARAVERHRPDEVAAAHAAAYGLT
jgi:glycosyltransferase involved in cell wall biosynthesis